MCSTYRDRLRREHGAQLLRVRWYGHRDASARTQRLWVERKTHRERWTGETSVKVHGIVQRHM
jgi:SPX domain protein involved in polyphosphate accumulation